MSKVTSKLQVTIPKHLAGQFGIRAGDEIAWQAVGDSIRISIPRERKGEIDVATRLKWFDQATERQKGWQLRFAVAPAEGDRGWTRQDLYDEGRSH